MDERVQAVEFYMKAVRTGERTASERLAEHLAPDVELDTTTQPGQPVGRETLTGKEAVLNRVSGIWPSTPGFMRTGWSEPVADGDSLKVTGTNNVVLTFRFNAKNQLCSIHQEGGWGGFRHQEVDTIPDSVCALIDHALANDTPIIVTYVDEAGQPHSSLRGSVVTYSRTQIGIWVRHPGGLGKALETNNRLSLAYSDRRARSPCSYRVVLISRMTKKSANVFSR